MNGAQPHSYLMNLSNLAKLLSICTIAIVFAFLINNYLTYAGDWPGPLSFYSSFNIFNLTQLLIYLVAILFPLLTYKTSRLPFPLLNTSGSTPVKSMTVEA